MRSISTIESAHGTTYLDALEIAKKLNIDSVTDATIRNKLDLSSIGEKHFDIPLVEALEKYFGEYFVSAKALSRRLWLCVATAGVL